MTRAARLAPPVFALLGAGGALLAWGVQLAAHVRRLGGEASPQRAEQLILVAAGVGMAAVGTWLCVGTVVCLVDLLRHRSSHPAGPLRPRVVQRALIRACAPTLSAAVLCAGGPVAADTGDLDPLEGLPLPERPAVTMPVQPSESPPHADGQEIGPGTTPTLRAERARSAVRIVRPGECLWGIAADLLAARSPARGAGTREADPPPSDVDRAWRRLYAANRSVVGPVPDLVQPGTRLVLPRPLRPSPPTSR